MDIPQIPERFIRSLWQHQRFRTSALSTADGKPVIILSPGTPNQDSGPDFLGASIRIGNITFYGDVELHRDASSWSTHRHASDPHYNRVILHVVMTSDTMIPPARTASRRVLPLLVLHPFLDPQTRVAWESALLGDVGSTSASISCSAVNHHVPAGVILPWMTRLAAERIELRLRSLEERLKQLIDERASFLREPYPRYYGNPDEIPHPQREYRPKDFSDRHHWEQLLYEGIMEGMGYAKNGTPFRALAQSMRLSFLRMHGLTDSQTMMALLFGAAGLLPSSRTLPEKESRTYVRSLRRRWRQLRPSFRATLLHEGDWMFFRLRPPNFPTARLATLCYLLPSLLGEDCFRRLIGVFKSGEQTAHRRLQTLQGIFSGKPDGYWRHHYYFGGFAGRNGAGLGVARINDLIINTIVPVVLLYARLFRDPLIRANAHELLKILPPADQNTITRMLQTNLLRDKVALNSALIQQGAIQLYKFYCAPARCGECAIGAEIPLGYSHTS